MKSNTSEDYEFENEKSPKVALKWSVKVELEKREFTGPLWPAACSCLDCTACSESQ